jgi:hypothetical protein
MFTIGLLIFLALAGMAFWILIFLGSFIPLWIFWSFAGGKPKADEEAVENPEAES